MWSYPVCTLLYPGDGSEVRKKAREVPGSPSGLNTGNGIEGAMVCTSLGSLLRPLFYFLCLKAKPVIFLNKL